VSGRRALEKKMGKWNDTDVPIAYLITFRTYGTWLAGDARGSIDRFNNTYGTPRAPSNVIREQQQAAKLKSEPFLMNAAARKAVSEAMRDICSFRGWRAYALNVRTNHAHIVTAGQASPDKMLGDLKAYSTRRLRATGCWPRDHSPWVDKGSKRNLWNEDQVSAAIEYVLFGQGDDLPDFDQ
jgi:REP element-mobilizing transposase RayT